MRQRTWLPRFPGQLHVPHQALHQSDPDRCYVQYMQLSSLGLALNPCASITIQGGVEPPSFLVQAPIKGAQISQRIVGPDELPEAHRFLASALVRGEAVEDVSAQGIAELRQIGLLAPFDELPQVVHYSLATESHSTDAMSLDQIRASANAGAAASGAALRIPEEWADRELRFQPHHHGSVWAPVLADGPSSTTSITDDPVAELDAKATRDFFAREGFAELPNLLPPSQVAELGRYFQALAAEGFMALDLDRGCRRHVAHNHPVANFWHDQLNERVSQLVGRRTKPSYSFVSMYVAGGDLKWHTDRPPCEYTVTLLLDYAPLDEQARSRWALKVTGRDGYIHDLHQRIGDALIFKGRELSHCREVLQAGHRSASVLFHFVDADYDGVME